MELAEVIGHLAVLRRFPVEPLGGETPSELVVGPEGAVGDRIFELIDGETGSPLTTESAPSLLSYSARFLEDLVARDLPAWMRVRTPDGKEFPLEDPEWVTDASRRLDRPLTLRPREPESPEHRVLHLLSRPTLRLLERAYGAPFDPLWFRSNFLVELTEARAFEEDFWIGGQVRIGDTLCEVFAPSHGCLALARSAESPAGDFRMVEGLMKVRGGSLGVCVRAVAGQRIRVADPVSLVH